VAQDLSGIIIPSSDNPLLLCSGKMRFAFHKIKKPIQPFLIFSIQFEKFQTAANSLFSDPVMHGPDLGLHILSVQRNRQVQEHPTTQRKAKTNQNQTAILTDIKKTGIKNAS
jgi:hypothetical protein